jgi:hypothetical protein
VRFGPRPGLTGVQSTSILVPVLALLGCLACNDGVCIGPICFGETGDGAEDPPSDCDETDPEPGCYWCDELGYCLLESPTSDRVKTLIHEGQFVPHSMGTCEEPQNTWEPFALFESDWQMEAACCEDMGCEGKGSLDPSFEICMPEIPAWDFDGLVGAIAPLDAWGTAQCDEVPPLAFMYDYLYAVHCHAVACEEWRTDCACKCDDSGACWDFDDALEDSYFEADALIDAGWESACTGVPYRWNQWAYGEGGWVGGSCEFNQPWPSQFPSGSEPAPDELLKVLSQVDCVRGSCSLTLGTFNHIVANVGILASSDVALTRRGIEITRCNDLCDVVGLSAGSMVIGVGRSGSAPLEIASWSMAHEEFIGDGWTTITVQHPGRARPSTIDIVQE